MKTGLEDGVHPNETGYACMGKYWSEQLLSYLNQTPIEPTPGSTTATVTTTTTETTTSVTASSETETTTRKVHPLQKQKQVKLFQIQQKLQQFPALRAAQKLPPPSNPSQSRVM